MECGGESQSWGEGRVSFIAWMMLNMFDKVQKIESAFFPHIFESLSSSAATATSVFDTAHSTCLPAVAGRYLRVRRGGGGIWFVESNRSDPNLGGASASLQRAFLSCICGHGSRSQEA